MVENQFQADFILYNAGTDCLRGDPLGNLLLSAEGIVKRDEAVFSFAKWGGVKKMENSGKEWKIPVAMVLSGGYQLSNAEVIFASIQNLNEKFSLFGTKMKGDEQDIELHDS